MVQSKMAGILCKQHLVNLATAAALLLALPAQAATFNVSDAASLITAINTANASSEADVIDLGGSTITLTTADVGDPSNGLPHILTAATAGKLIITNGTITRDNAAPQFRFLTVDSGASLMLDTVTLSNGRARDGANAQSGGNPGQPGESGGAILNSGTLSLSNSTLSGNTAGNGGNGHDSVGGNGGSGGAISSSGTVNLSNSTLSGNTAGGGGNGIRIDGGNGGSGGAISSSGTVSLSNSTLSGNTAGNGSNGNRAAGLGGSSGGLGGSGGAISGSGTLSLSNSTLFSNTAGDGGNGSGGGANGANGTGSALFANNPSVPTLSRNILSGPPNVCAGFTAPASGSNNLITDTSCGNDNVVLLGGSVTSPTMLQLDFAGLQNNGGPTQTIALCTGSGTPAGCGGASPAINATGGTCLASPTLGLDQRGFLRDGNCDIGAYEALATAASFDFGDAPSTYPVTLAQDGARHVRDVSGFNDPKTDVDMDSIPDVLDNCPNLLNTDQIDSDNDGSGAACDINDNNASVGGSGRRARPYLGTLYSDPESNGQSTASADGDDANVGAPDDEDGVTLPITLTAGTAGNIVVTTPRGAFLSAWIDYNRDGDWDDADEQIANQFAASPGPNTLTPAVPGAASPGSSVLRLRVCSNLGQCNTPTGLAADGEVEDHPVTIAPPPAPAVSLSATSLNFGSVTVGNNSAAQSVTVTNSGTANLTLSNVATTGDTTQFQPVVNNPCLSTTTLTPGQSCTIAAIFAPTSTGAKSATVTVASNAPNNPHSVTLTGTGITASGGSTGGGFPVTPGGAVPPSNNSNDTSGTNSGSGSSATTTTSSGSSGGCAVNVNGNNGLHWLAALAVVGFYSRRRRGSTLH